MKIETKYNIGDMVYVIISGTLKEYNDAIYKRENFRSGKYSVGRTIIKEIEIEGFIIDNDGVVHPAVDGWDGWNKIVTYNSINDKVYDNLQSALAELRA